MCGQKSHLPPVQSSPPQRAICRTLIRQETDRDKLRSVRPDYPAADAIMAVGRDWRFSCCI